MPCNEEIAVLGQKQIFYPSNNVEMWCRRSRHGNVLNGHMAALGFALDNKQYQDQDLNSLLSKPRLPGYQVPYQDLVKNIHVCPILASPLQV